MTIRFKKTASAAVATALGASIVPLLFASSAGAAPTLEGPAEVTTPAGVALEAGQAATPFTLRLPIGAACTGDTANDAFLVQSYVVSDDVSLDTLTFNNDGPVVPAGSTGWPLMRTDGEFYLNNITAPASPSPGPGVIINIPSFNYAPFAEAELLPSGTYNIGIACVKAGEVFEYWNATVDLTAAGTALTWELGGGDIPVPPVITGVASADSALTVTFTDTPAESYTATATPDAADAQCATATAVTSTAATSVTPITIGSLVNDCTYDVVVNEADGALVSNALQGTPALRGPTNVVATPDVARVDLAWTAPVGPTVPTGYTVTGNPSGSTVVVTGTTAAVTDLLCGEAHDLTITPTYAAGTAGTPVAATVEAASYCNQTLEQHITVERPAGALVLTQECGEHGALPAEPAQAGWTDGLQAEDAVAGGVAPFTVWDDATWTGSAPDANHGQYPNPASPAYPTHCGIELGVAEMVTEGEGQGQFFRADGRLHQITVVDTRDTDPLGWTVNGTMSDFKNVDMPGESFSGNALGWTPIVTSTSDAFDHDLDPATPDYDQVATKGDAVAPGANPGLGDGQALASAANGSDLGIAELDARIKLLIPVSAPAGEYQGTLTFTVI